MKQHNTKLIRNYFHLLIGIIIGVGAISCIWYVTSNPATSDDGDFLFVVNKPTNTTYLKHYVIFSENGPKLVDLLNKQFKFPTDVSLVIDECNDPDPKYYNTPKKIVICYIFLEEAFQFPEKYKSSIGESGIADLRNGLVLFVIYHEIAHALIDVFNIPVIGNDEIAADQFATMLLLDQMRQEARISYVLSGPMQFFADESKSYSDFNKTPYWQKHSIGVQRSSAILCLAYGKFGSDPFHYINIEKYIPPTRLQNCSIEFQTISKNWEVLLKDYLKPNSNFG